MKINGNHEQSVVPMNKHPLDGH